MTAWLRLSRREEAWQTAEILILRHQLAILQRRQPRHPHSSPGVPDPDGAVLAAGGKPERQALAGHSETVQVLAVAQDGSSLASAGADGTVRIWDLSTGAALMALRVDDSLEHLAWTHSALVAAGRNGLYTLRPTS